MKWVQRVVGMFRARTDAGGALGQRQLACRLPRLEISQSMNTELQHLHMRLVERSQHFQDWAEGEHLS